MRRAKSLLGWLVAIAPLPAIAEVCDKEMPRWDPANGPAGPWDTLVFAAMSPVGVILFFFVLLALLWRKVWTAALGAFVVTALGAMVLLDWLNPGSFAMDARLEGCFGPPAPVLGVLWICAVGFCVIATKRRANR